MRIVVLDYAGHIPQADLARNLARLGHNVRHMYCSDYVSGRGAVERVEKDPPELEFINISIKKDFNRYSPIERLKHEFAISDEFWLSIQEFNPDHTIFSNVPLIAMSRLSKKMQQNDRPYLFWWQDVYSIAMGNALRKFGPISWPAQQFLLRLERKILKGAQAIVAISANFEPVYRSWKLDPKKFSIYPNWTPTTLFEKKSGTGANSKRKLAVYAGTLGMKHRPELLLHLADDPEFKELGGIVVVVSQGYGREMLEKPENMRENIELKNFLSITELGELFSAASVLLAVLEPEASAFSVPSKIMSYLSAGKPIVASIDSKNASAVILQETGAGIVISPESLPSEFCKAVIEIMSDSNFKKKMGDEGVKYAIENFDGKKAAHFFTQCLFNKTLRISKKSTLSLIK